MYRAGSEETSFFPETDLFPGRQGVKGDPIHLEGFLEVGVTERRDLFEGDASCLRYSSKFLVSMPSGSPVLVLSADKE